MYSLKIFYENMYPDVSYDFSKFNEFKNQGVTFLMVPPKNGFAP
jgi:hypothetical protein